MNLIMREDGISEYKEQEKVAEKVKAIFNKILQKKDEALFELTYEFEKHAIDSRTVKVNPREMNLAWRQVPEQDKKIIGLAAKRIEDFHRKQKLRPFVIKEKTGIRLEQRTVPVDRVGICIPAGRAPLFSTVLMTVIPATIAGVEEIAMISPWPQGRMNAYILAAARIAGVKEIYKIGGVQGVAALTYGTASVPRVNKIVGPGSIWVTEAKAYAASLGGVDIDTFAGPSEIVILADGSVPANFAASDLISQLEHGEDSLAFLLTPDLKYAEEVVNMAESLVKSSSRQAYLETSLRQSAFVIICNDLDEAIKHVNNLAPEHLEILVRNPRKILLKIRNAASIFLGPYSPVPVGDYLAGPNHVLPTEYRARFASPLGVEDFVKRQSVVEFSKEALLKLGPVAERMAELEGLDGHAQAIRIRREALDGKKSGKKRR